ncbi:hypothetical protein OB955_18750 [Halobacteria archaeon AArc-m2/3/4]|uniref:Uncharacterized protein n=1 Tax=Natronoglomus mannanivorans TaxID=2979990 RepID=A0AAP2Z1L0_9EURY|nr:hypothetical protein [Halobacteria archaeon AArc-xg1-1]MCU4974763.1 hypothetical protein [Halobacteria archaeon AArc-m2/3/4]
MTDTVSEKSVTRRQFLAATGVVAMGGLAGCVNQVVARTTNTGASPAAMFGGIRNDQFIGVTAGETFRLSPIIRVEEGSLSGDITLESWITNAKVAPAQDYNSVRSNKCCPPAFDPILDESDDEDEQDEDDDSNDTDGVLSAVLELERQLLSQTNEAAEAIERSARTGRNPQTGKEIQVYLDEMMNTIDEIRSALERCSDDVCVTVRNHADGRKKLTQQASSYFEHDQDFSAAEEAVQEIQTIVEGDIDLLESSLKSPSTSGQASRIARVQDLTGASDDEIRGMYEYLEQEPVLSERCIITLPDARAPRDGPTVESLITPDRLIEFVTGQADDEGKLYSWGSNEYEAATTEDDDDESESCEQHSSGEGLSTEGHVYCWGDNSTTAISGPIHTYGSLDVVQSSSSVGVINTPPVATDEKSKIGVTSDGQPTAVDNLDEWGRENGPASSTSTIVCQVLVQPAGCPCPFPALLHVQRHKNNDQYVYSCGWVIDDSCLYEDSTTVLMGSGGSGAGEAVFTDISVADSGEISADEIKRLLPDDVSSIGSQMFDGRLDGAVRSGIIPDDELAKTVAQTVSSNGDVYCVCTPFNGPYLHLAADGETNNVVKFKAGAELSKSVN